MNGELLAILEQLERDKGIKKEVLIQAVESALLSAAKRILSEKKDIDIKVELDRETGEIRAFAGDKQIKSKDFGRIAAQTAKQVVIQKIREAEKDAVISYYSAKLGTIVTGLVLRHDGKNVIMVGNEISRLGAILSPGDGD